MLNCKKQASLLTSDAFFPIILLTFRIISCLFLKCIEGCKGSNCPNTCSFHFFFLFPVEIGAVCSWLCFCCVSRCYDPVNPVSEAEISDLLMDLDVTMSVSLAMEGWKICSWRITKATLPEPDGGFLPILASPSTGYRTLPGLST